MDLYELYTSIKFSSSKPHDFMIQLNRTLNLNEHSTLEVLAWSYDSQKKKARSPFYLFTDIVQNSFFFGSEQSVIGMIKPSFRKSEHYYVSNPIKVRTTTGTVNRFRVYIRDEKYSDSSVDITSLTLTLRFNNVSLK